MVCQSSARNSLSATTCNDWHAVGCSVQCPMLRKKTCSFCKVMQSLHTWSQNDHLNQRFLDKERDHEIEKEKRPKNPKPSDSLRPFAAYRCPSATRRVERRTRLSWRLSDSLNSMAKKRVTLWKKKQCWSFNVLHTLKEMPKVSQSILGIPRVHGLQEIPIQSFGSDSTRLKLEYSRKPSSVHMANRKFTFQEKWTDVDSKPPTWLVEQTWEGGDER